MPDSRRSRGADEGVATVWTATAVAALLVLVGLLFCLGSAAVARHRAANAADLAALAAAAHASHGTDSACARARRVAGLMDVRLATCRLAGSDALVRVELVPDGILGEFGSARARARAGPAEPEHATSGTSGG